MRSALPLRAVLVLTVSWTLSACSGGDSDYDFAANIPPPSNTQTSSEAVFDPANARIPPSNNLLFGQDGTLDIPIVAGDPAAPLKQTMNDLDGFSTVAPVTAEFSTTLDGASLVAGQSVRVFKVNADPATGAVQSVVSELGPTDFVVAAAGQNLTTLAILPLNPLEETSTYLVVLTNGIKDSAGSAMKASQVYNLTKLTSPYTNPDLAALEPVRQLVNTYEAAAATQGVNAADIILSWAFTTLSTTSVLNAVAGATAPGALVMADTTLTTGAILGTAGTTAVYAGTLELPYYLDAASPISSFWKSASGQSVNRFAPMPVATGTQTIPALMTVPAAAAPLDGWPVVIFQHGITQDRSNLLAIADSLALAGFAGIAIDLPLHGITDNANPLSATNTAFPTDVERTFNLDLVSNATGAPGPDGTVDASGTHFINLQSLLTSRDNVRQAVADLLVLRDSLAGLVTASGPVVVLDDSQVHYVGHSLGGIVGTVYLAFDETVEAASLAMPGGGIARLLDGSATFGPRIEAGLAVQGVIKGTADYDSFMVVAQTAMDAADPVNHGEAAAALHPVHMIEVVGGNSGLPDQVIPNSVPGAPLSGTEPLARVMGLAPVSATTMNAAGVDGLVRFVTGDHSSILDPTADMAATVEMQSEVAGYMASSGAVITVTDPSVIQP